MGVEEKVDVGLAWTGMVGRQREHVELGQLEVLGVV